MKYQNVIERVYDQGHLYQAWQQVCKNASVIGIDQLTVEIFECRKEKLLELIQDKLKAGTYHFKPARRLPIPKADSSKMRKFGIPVVMDRVVSQSINSVLEQIFEPDLNDFNFEFRKEKSQHQVIQHVQRKVTDDYGWCVSVDLKAFFDKIPHNRIFKLIRKKITDEPMMTLISRALKTGVRVNGKVNKITKGCPQGSAVLPMISNIVLNELDHELGGRNHLYCRWKDDFVVLLKSKKAAERVMAGIIRYLEEELDLPVNKEKSLVAEVKRVSNLTHWNHPLPRHRIILVLFRNLDAWIRSQLRSIQLKKWKKSRKF